jgi:hypothetical protein
MPSFDELYEFLKSYYLHSRFEGRNGAGWDDDYSQIVTKSAYEYLELHGIGWISMYESRTATAIKYNQELEILNPDEAPGQIQKKAGRLTSILGSSAW